MLLLEVAPVVEPLLEKGLTAERWELLKVAAMIVVFSVGVMIGVDL